MDYDLINYNELEPYMDFSILVIQYFRNEYYMIADFLKGDSPWDRSIMWIWQEKENRIITEQELIYYKKKMSTMIISTYYDRILKPIIDSDSEERYASIVDLPYIDLLNQGKDPATAFFCSDRCIAVLLRNYIDVIEYKRNINIDTSKKYTIDISYFVSLYQDLFVKHKLNLESLSKDRDNHTNLQKFYLELYLEIKKYLSENFRSEDDCRAFIDYFYSIIYANIQKKSREGNELLDEDEDIINHFETEEDLFNIFFTNAEESVYMLELLYEMYLENGLDLDFRKKHASIEERNLYIKRDMYYEDKFPDDFVIDGYQLDIKLNYIIGYFSKLSKSEITETLLSHESIYGYLLDAGLDARFSKYYKIKIIRKIISELYAYELYLINEDPNYHSNIYENISKIEYSDNAILSYFKINHELILNRYFKVYNHQDDYIKERVRFLIYNSGNLKQIYKINEFALVNYFDIMLGKINQLKSVDCMNHYLKCIFNSMNENGVVNLTCDYGFDNLVRIICLNVYESILLLEGCLNDKNIIKIKEIIENVDDITSYAYNNKEFFQHIVSLFVYLNHDYVTYKCEIKKREGLKTSSYYKVLKKINPYQEGI